MSFMSAITQNGIYFLILLALTPPLGAFMFHVFSGQKTLLSPVMRPVERAIYRATRVDETREMRWTTYTVAVMCFSSIAFLVVYMTQRLQHSLPLNPQDLPNVEQRSSFNTAVSFMTNTNWQGYGGETTMSYLTQMVGLTVQNFVSAAAGIAIAIAVIRGFSRRSTNLLGNFWVDLVRGVLYILLPISIVVSLLLVSRGVPQNFNRYTVAHTLIGAEQVIAQGPAAAQIAIKQLGTNGGGFFNANSSHPFENPTPFTNFLEALAILLIASALTYTFGKMVGNTKQGWALFAAMGVIFFIGVAGVTVAEQDGNPILMTAGANQSTTIAGYDAPGGNMESKEVRFGVPLSAQWAVATTAASNGSVNSMHDSFTPLGGMILLVNIQLGEIIFGGVGSGLYGMLIFAIIAIFIAGLMVGRTPEYLGKKIEKFDVKMAMLAILILPLSILGFTGVAAVTGWGLNTVFNPGPHGLSEILYAYSSGTGNNGSAFAGLGTNTPFFNVTIGLAMLIGRFGVIVPAMALAGSLAAKKRSTSTTGTFPTTGPLWVGLLVGVIFVVGALTFFPALSLGPVIEHVHMTNGVTFGNE